MVVNVFLTVRICQRRNVPTKKERAKVRFFATYFEQKLYTINLKLTRALQYDVHENNA